MGLLFVFSFGRRIHNLRGDWFEINDSVDLSGILDRVLREEGLPYKLSHWVHLFPTHQADGILLTNRFGAETLPQDISYIISPIDYNEMYVIDAFNEGKKGSRSRVLYEFIRQHRNSDSLQYRREMTKLLSTERALKKRITDIEDNQKYGFAFCAITSTFSIASSSCFGCISPLALSSCLYGMPVLAQFEQYRYFKERLKKIQELITIIQNM